MLNTIKNTKVKLENHILLHTNAVAVGAGTTCAIICSNLAYAGEGEELIGKIISILAALVIAPAVMLAIMGLIGYATAHSEGDGPAQQKAVGKLTAAALLIIVSIILGNEKDTLAGYITNIQT